MGVLERRQRERAEKRARILDAAEHVFLDKGLAAATMEEIAAEAEVSKGTLYLYFKSKDDLYTAIAVRALGEIHRAFDREIRASRDGFDRVRRLLVCHARYAAKHADRLRVSMSWLLSEYSVDAETPSFVEYRAAIGRLFQVGIEAIELGKRDGTVRADIDARELAVQLWGGHLGTLLVSSNGREMARRLPIEVDWTKVTRGYIDLILRGIRPEPEGRSRAMQKERVA